MSTWRYVSSYSTPDEEVHSFWYHAAMSPVGLISGGAPPMRPCKSPLTLNGSSRGTAPFESCTQSQGMSASCLHACLLPISVSGDQSSGCWLLYEVALSWHEPPLRAC